MPDLDIMIQRQQVLADFGDFALRSDNLDEVLTEACRLVAQALKTARAKVLEIQEDGQELLVRAGVGWGPDVVGHLRLPMSQRSSETYSIREAKPTITQDIEKENRFEVPAFMKEAGVIAFVNVPIFVPGLEAYGLLQVDATEPRDFGEEDTQFLRTYSSILGPVIDRLLTVKRLRASEERFRAFVNASSDVVYRMSPDWSEMRQLDGRGFLSDTVEPNRAWVERYIEADDRDTVLATISQAISIKSLFDLEHRVRRADGLVGWTHSRAVPILNREGEIVEWLGAAKDVTDRRQAEEHKEVLVAELQHRTRNLVGVVRATFEATLRSSRDLDDFATKYRDRLAALARVQALLSRLRPTQRVTFDALLRDEIHAVGAVDRVTLAGPAGIALRSSTVQTFALALHELTTNAVKYGALRQPSGRLVITWHLEPAQNGGEPWLHVDWHESGVTMPPAGAAPQGSGQGRMLIERALPYQLGARTTYAMGPDGVRCSIAVPVSSRTAAEETENERPAAS